MIDPARYGVSFSLKQCRNFGLDPHATLDWLIAQGFRRFRLMSYWNEHEKEQGKVDFTELDWQIAAVEQVGGVVTLALGVKQPRWPEYHWPAWALELPAGERETALLQFTRAVVARYRGRDCIIQYQLENEALLKGFGRTIIISRKRLRQEYALVRQLDPGTPVAMSTSNGWGVPIRAPHPAAVGFSYYPIMFAKGQYRATIQKPWLHQIRKILIEDFLHMPVFIHELQLEPWGPTAIWKMNTAEQDKSMSPAQIRRNIEMARGIGAFPIDLWGGEWWYWRSLQGDDSIISALHAALK